MSNPTCWRDILNCRCGACRALAEIYVGCVHTSEPLFVCDCRMYDLEQPWIVADVHRLFVEPMPAQNRHPTRQLAVGAVLSAQRHCDVFESSWPLRPYGKNDYLWSREAAEP